MTTLLGMPPGPVIALDPLTCAAVVSSSRWKIQRHESGCHLWMRRLNNGGYPFLKIGRTEVRAHRVAWVAANGRDIPAGLQIDHVCRNTACVNPEHLEAVTPRVNTLRGSTTSAANAAKTHCPRGHELSGENLRASHPGRLCLRCFHEHDRMRRQTVRAAAEVLGIGVRRYWSIYGHNLENARTILALFPERRPDIEEEAHA